jgi:glycosyltransferase involved in cell wall biosynthesis
MKWMKNIKYLVSVVIPARNEQEYIERSLVSLSRQTLKPNGIIVVNDGSIDQTAQISAKYADVINLPIHEENYAGRPELAKILNEGLKQVPGDSDYVLILGADQSLPEKYIESIVLRMVQEDVKIASGYIKGEPHHPEMPRGGGRIYDFKIFKMIGFFPVNWGWESHVLFKAMQMGYKVKCYRDIDTGEVRATSISKRKLYYYGKGMKALGYDLKYALGRAILNRSWNMFRGYISKEVNVYKDIAEFTREWQRKIFWSRIRRVLYYKGRK